MFIAKIARKLAPLLILAAAVVGFLVLRATGPSAPLPEASERAWQVRGIGVEMGVNRPTLQLFGRTSSPQTAVLQAAIEGEIGQVPVRAGDIVEAGGLLVYIDTAETRLTLTQREAELSEVEAAVQSERVRAEADTRALVRERALVQIAQRGLDRARDLRTRDLGSEVAVDDAQRSLEQARLALDAREQAVADAPSRLAQGLAREARTRAAVERAQLDLRRAEIRAYSNLRVVEVHVSPGERVRVGDPLVRAYVLDDLEIRASLPELVLPRITRLLGEQQKLEAHATVGGQSIHAELVRLSGETRPGEAGISALFRVTDGAQDLPLNRFVNLHLSLPEEPDSMAVPFEALYGRDRVYRVVDSRLQGLQVERLGEVTDPAGRTLALIRHPELETGDILVVTRLPNAVDGLQVQVSMDLPAQGL
jgi:multidrug efflux pump subunit AcrA (membrane-fusion protein)